MEKNPDLEKLQKLKAAIKKDVEKKQGKKFVEKSPEKKKITLSDELMKRLTYEKSVNIDLEKIFTVIDIEREYSEIKNYELVEYIRKNVQSVSDNAMKMNLEGLASLIDNDFESARKIYLNMVSENSKDYLFYNLLDAMFLGGDNVEKPLFEFVKKFPKSPYPYIMSVKISLTDNKKFANIARLIGIGLKMSQDENLMLFYHLMNRDFQSALKINTILYRKNSFKDFQNINRLIPYKMEKDLSSLRMNIDNLSKREKHHCLNQYLQLITKEKNKDRREENFTCPLSVFFKAKEHLVNGEEEKAKWYSEQLKRINDPFGKMITASMLYSENYKSAAYNIWFDLTKMYPNSLIMWIKNSKSEVKGLGIGAGIMDVSMEKMTSFSDLADFQAYMEKMLAVYSDFEISPYPFEEIRCFFGYRFCSRYYKLEEK